MYQFIDVNETPSSDFLPSEALKLNGEYIENLVPGYRTLSVSGREALSPELGLLESENVDGARLRNRRFKPREIVVQYKLSSASPEAFRTAYNALGGVLNVTDAQLIFNDEPDKFFTGTPQTIGTVEPGRKNVIGEIVFLCLDPFKYSLQEYSAALTEVNGFKGFSVNYGGTYKAFPRFESRFHSDSEDGVNEKTLTDDGDCGFVAMFNDRGNILQFGDPEELDGEAHAWSQTLMNQTFKTSGAWGTTAKKLWSVNSGISTPHAEAQVGSVGMVQHGSYWMMEAANYGSSTADRYGASITRKIGADAAGETGAANFTLTFNHKNCPSAGNAGKEQCGIFYALVVSGTGASRKILAGIRISKHSVGDYSGKVLFYVNGAQVAEVPVDIYHNNAFFGTGGKQVSTITKANNTVIFDICGIKRSFSVNSLDFAAEKALEVTFHFARYKSAEPLEFNGFSVAKFVKNNCDTFSEIPNKFSADDVLEADCKTGKVYLNGLEKPELGALGNDWEEFYLRPGLNEIGVSYSDWLTDDFAPEIVMKYREAFL